MVGKAFWWKFFDGLQTQIFHFSTHHHINFAFSQSVTLTRHKSILEKVSLCGRIESAMAKVKEKLVIDIFTLMVSARDVCECDLRTPVMQIDCEKFFVAINL